MNIGSEVATMASQSGTRRLDREGAGAGASGGAGISRSAGRVRPVVETVVDTMGS
jgi:hypothetical protein